ncbi:MAG: imidazole glycerol phosphate synthase subunit HisH [Gammaproteobacteria bacterium]|jgi:glutamine amidotransferase|nr:imidazole glycerol phosphate synthase subunit HisH [Gammaproteobacteria bacterium]
MPAAVAVVDSGGANIASLRFALRRLGHDSVLTTDPQLIAAAERVILPGVGAARDAMQKLQAADLVETLRSLTQPLLGICLGMQLLFEHSEEDGADCLGIIGGQVRKLDVADDQPVPHMGWNRVTKARNAALLDGIPDGAHFYFVHSYAADIVTSTTGITSYGRDFTSVVRQGNFMGTQFHPERSGPRGAQLLDNFMRLT